MSDFPTEFRGCIWDEHWEFDAPCVVYFPVKIYSPNAGNSGKIDQLVEDYCIRLALGESPEKGFSANDIFEFKWRGWGTRFERRKKAHHVVIKVRWFIEDGEQCFEFTHRYETAGPPPNKRVQPTRQQPKSTSRSKARG